VDSSAILVSREGKDWVWREDKVRALLAGHNQGNLFVSGCAQNMVRLFPLIDKIVLLSAPAATIMRRLESRASNGYGDTEAKRRKVRELITVVEPLLRQSADYEITTTRPVGETADEIVGFANSAHVVGWSK
jgi:shikimate kinase